jgi:hypothetical protein
MPPEHQSPRLFTLRLWQAAVDDAPGAVEWRGKVQTLPEGDACYFRDWPGLIRHLEAMLETPRQEAAHSETQDGGNL